MKFQLQHILLVVTAFFYASHPARAFGKKKKTTDIEICPNLIFTRSIGGDFSANEKRLACGKFPGDDSNLVQAWEKIPENQRIFNVTSFLQARGYHHPVFKLREDSALVVNPGPLSRVSSLHAEDAPPGFGYDRKRKVVGEILTPALLDGVKKWTKEELDRMGYACAKIELGGDPDTGEVKVVISAGDQVILSSIHEDEIPGLTPGILRRYDAFKMNEIYNGDLMTLSERRATTDGQVEGLHYRVNSCHEGKVSVDQETVVGKPRLLAISAGIDTEGVVLGRVSWSNTRLGPTASLLNVTLSASTIHQLLSTHAEYYFLSDPTRLYLRPSVSFEHINWDPYETATAAVDLSPATSWDTSGWGGSGKLGPVNDYIRTFRGTGPPTGRYLFLEGVLHGATHDYDFYQTSPRKGVESTLTVDVNSPSFFSDYEAQRVKLSFTALLNPHDDDPPLFVLGVRGFIATTFTTFAKDPYGINLPPTFLQFLGGSGDMRGYGLQELPHSGIGTLSAGYFGTEFRYASGLWLGIQPFLFMDVGALGVTSTALNAPVFLSPGFGLRDETPFGSVRLTLAHGYAVDDSDPTLSHFQFYFSFGEEF